jgi:hypothetical protein
MSSQIFKSDIPLDKLVTFLDYVCDRDGEMLVFNNEAYKRAILKESLAPFLQSLVEHYHVSKRFYVERKMSYPKCLTVIRQLCRHLEIEFTSKVIYRRSTYDIVYYVRIGPH